MSHLLVDKLSSRRIQVFAVAISFGLLLAATATGHFQMPKQTFSETCDGEGIDPLNVLFYPETGGGASGVQVDDHVEKHAGWGSSSGGTQAIKSHGGCEKQATQSSLGFRRKHHVRYFNMHTDDLRTTSFGDAHIERLVNDDCPGVLPDHAVYKSYEGRSGFDYGAYELRTAFRGTHHTYGGYAKRPHRRRYQQCNGDKVPWNGRLLYFIGGFTAAHPDH
jgi:hypothetical protein